MPFIRCTAKLQKEMGLKKSDINNLVELNNAGSKSSLTLGDWHANLLFIDRKKCVLFANDKTLLNFIAPDVSRAEIRNLDELFISYLYPVLATEGIPPKIVDSFIQEYSKIIYAPTNSKKILGSMNDLAWCYKHMILSDGGVHSCMVPTIISQMNKMPMKPIDYERPTDMLAKLL